MGSAVECEEVKLIGGPRSPFVSRVRIALKLKGVEFKFHEERYGIKSELLLKSNPVHKKSPILLHNGMPICESLVIVQYIDEVWSSGPRILSADPYDRAIECFCLSYVDEKWIPSLNEVLTSNIREEEVKVEALQQVEVGVIFLEDVFNKTSKGKPYFSGEDWMGYLDIGFGSFLYRLKVLERYNKVSLLDEAKTPGLARWSEKFLADPIVKSVLVGVDELLEFFKIIAKKMDADAAMAADKKSSDSDRATALVGDDSNIAPIATVGNSLVGKIVSVAPFDTAAAIVAPTGYH